MKRRRPLGPAGGIALVVAIAVWALHGNAGQRSPVPHWVDSSIDTPIEHYRLQVKAIDPNTAAAKSDLKVGDVVTTIDGIDVSGLNVTRASTLTSALPGTKLTFGLARGVTVAIVLAAPP